MQNKHRIIIFLTLLAAALASSCAILPGRWHLPETDSDRFAAQCITDRNGVKLHWQAVPNAVGRITRLDYTDPAGAIVQQVNLDTARRGDVPHVIIALDGTPYALVKRLYDDGLFRMFYRPAISISCFPSMTDLAFYRIFGGARPTSFQALYFDRDLNEIAGGNSVYLKGDNAGWMQNLDYHCTSWLHSQAYLTPELIFDHELSEIAQAVEPLEHSRFIAYSVGSSGIITIQGEPGAIDYLRSVDAFCNYLIARHHGAIHITLLADHGHNLSGRRRVTFDDRLEAAGYRLTDTLSAPGDVVTVNYGLITYAAFYTDDPAGVADVLVPDPAVALACYQQNDAVIVQNADGQAAIRYRAGRYRYDCFAGDPLELNPILAGMKLQDKLAAGSADSPTAPLSTDLDTLLQTPPPRQIDADGWIHEGALFAASYDAPYPDPLRRIWFAFNGLVRSPPDLIVTLHDGNCHGRALFDAVIGQASSSHGSLNRQNSQTFVMTTLGPLPAAMTLEQIMPTLTDMEDTARNIKTPLP